MQPETSLYGSLREALAHGWRRIARPEQLAPPGEWDAWLVLAGRGFGKTRTGAEWIQETAASGTVARLGMIAPTAADARDVMLEGESGILAIAPTHARPIYEPSRRQLTWPNGVIGKVYSAEEPERLRGPQHGKVWADEVGAWADARAVWDQMMFGLRLGPRPQVCVTTTPRPIEVIRDLLKREGHGVVVTRGSTRDNAANLAPGAVDKLEARYAGTRLGRQELDGEFLDDVVGALWQRDWIDRDRVIAAPELLRVVVAVDPAVSAGEKSNETGIVVAGIARDGHVYVLADYSLSGSPREWAARAVQAYREHTADVLVGEANQGGDLVKANIQTVDPLVNFRKVHASRGKVVRAEPVASLAEQGKIHHVGTFKVLEDQLVAFTSDFDRRSAGYSPDRLDALVWAVTELAVKSAAPIAATGRYRMVGFSRPGFDPDQLAPLDAVRFGFCSPERAMREFGVTKEEIVAILSR